MSTSTIQVPERTDEQRGRALERANAVRLQRVNLKRQVTGVSAASAVLLDPPEYAETMKVEALLMAIPKWGDYRVRTALKATKVSPRKTIGGMTSRQRRELADWLYTTSREGDGRLGVGAGRGVVMGGARGSNAGDGESEAVGSGRAEL